MAAAMIPSRSIPTLDPTRLADLGWNESWASHLAATGAEGRPGRVLVAHRGACIVGTAEDDLAAEPSGTLRREAQSGGLLPAVGDWVVLAVDDGAARKAKALPRSGPATVEHILPRRSAISRKVKGKAAQVQVIAANVDTVFLVTGLDADFNPRRIERALVAVWDTGALPVVVLTKSDLSTDIEDKVKTVQALAAGVPVHAVSAREGSGLDALDPYRRHGSTIALLGSSGAGKSTLINRLLGWDRQDTGGVRAHDSRGRHTTTKRELIVLPDGGVLVDTPGLRELQLWEGEGGLDAVFADVTADAGACRFRDCSHHEEPGCAVRAAWAAGGVTPERVESYRKLQRELEHVASLRDERSRLERSRQEKVLHRAARKHQPRE
jgi:ribosome biogenesis GTPase / thiamine phosphate phosphatase